LMSASAFAQRAVRAIDKGSTTRIIPAPMAAVGTLLRWLPDAWLDRLLAGRARKRRRGSEPPASDGTTA
jgi:short-subunit dehydrogenase